MTGAPDLVSLYSDVMTKQVNWLWFPYIAYGKLTLLQGDPGDGKSTMMMHLIAEISRGGAMPDGTALGRPQRVIYQCAEDSVGDMIKPRLVKMGANCKNIAYINEASSGNLTLDDERIRDAIISFEPKLLVMDPIQAYIGNDSSLQIAGSARKLMRRLSIWAETYDCAIVLIGHMNKRETVKGLYRGLGSIDIMAAVRSVMQVERDPDDPHIRVVTHIKNSLEATGGEIRFEIRPGTGFKWLACAGASEPGRASQNGISAAMSFETKQEEAAHIMSSMLKERDVAASEMLMTFTKYDIAEKTVRAVKKQLGIRAYRKDRQWFWTIKKVTDGPRDTH